MSVKDYIWSKVHVIFRKRPKPDGSVHLTERFFKDVLGAACEDAENTISAATDEMIPASAHGAYLDRHAAIRRLPGKASWETEDEFRARVVNAWEFWEKAGRRAAIEELIEFFGFDATIIERTPAWAHFRVIFSGTLGRISWQELWRQIYRFKAAHTMPIFEPDYDNLTYGRFDDGEKFDDEGFFDDFVVRRVLWSPPVYETQGG